MRLFTIATLLAASLFVACSGKGEGKSTELAKQLVGHWETGGNDNLYFGATDASTGRGSYILVHPDGKIFEHRYEIDSADAGARKLELKLLFASGDTGETTYVLSKDGTSIDTTMMVTGIETHGHLTRVDEKTAP